MIGNLLRVLPRNWLSFLTGKLVSLPLPKPFSTWSIRIFGEFYNINFAEAEKPISEYKSIGDFFTRKLKPGARPISSSPLVHPADSRIAQIGEIRQGQCLQAKGKSYSVAELLQNESLSSQFQSGIFITYYLCPTDYHRVHSPVDGVVKRTIHIPGTLWPVNEWSVNSIENLYPKNERLVIEIESKMGKIVLVMVGATNVGKITTSFDPQISTNCGCAKKVTDKEYPGTMTIKKGEELGTFHMGSTVIALFPLTAIQHVNWAQFQDRKVRLGEALI